MHVYYQNVRGLRSKTTDFRLNILECDWDIIALTETWLNDSIHNAELFPNEYQVYRRDRCQNRTGMSRGGGVLIAVSGNIKIHRLNNLETEGENLWVKLEFPNKNTVIICVVYFPPNSHLNYYSNFFGKLETFQIKNEKLLILGDFNLPITGVGYKLETGTEICKQMLFFIKTYNLAMKNNVSNVNGKTLDLVLSDITSLNVEQDCCPIVKIDKHHPPLSITFNISVGCRNNIVSGSQSFNYKKADFLQLYNCFRVIDWNNLNNVLNVNEAVDFFYSKINNVISHCVPISRKTKPKYPPWFDNNIILLIKRKNTVRRKYVKYKISSDFQEYKEIRRRLKIDIKLAFKNYTNFVENRVKADPTSFWSIINKLRVVDNRSPVMCLDGETTDSGQFCQLFQLRV